MIEMRPDNNLLGRTTRKRTNYIGKFRMACRIERECRRGTANLGKVSRELCLPIEIIFRAGAQSGKHRIAIEQFKPYPGDYSLGAEQQQQRQRD